MSNAELIVNKLNKLNSEKQISYDSGISNKYFPLFCFIRPWN